MPFAFTALQIRDVILIEPRVFPDQRGHFLESYKRSEFEANGITLRFVQDNHSVSSAGTLRGLHFQLDPAAQGKLVRVVRGAVWDVAVDIRPASRTYLQWVAEELNEVNHKMLYIPPGFAHGFVALENDTHFLYKCTAEYARDLERGIRWDDPDLAIRWPLQHPTVSEKDAALPPAKEVLA